MLDGGVFRRQAERVVAHGVEHGPSLTAAEVRDPDRNVPRAVIGGGLALAGAGGGATLAGAGALAGGLIVMGYTATLPRIGMPKR